MRLPIVVLVCLSLSSASAQEFSETESTLHGGTPKSTEIGGAYKFQLKPTSDIDKISKRLYVEKVGDKYFVNRDLDKGWKDCMTSAGFRYIATNVGNAKKGSLGGAFVRLGDFSGAEACNEGWHQRVKDVALDSRFEALEIYVKEGRSTAIDYVDLVFNLVSTDVAVLEKDGKVLRADVNKQQEGLKLLEQQMTTLSQKHKDLAKAIIEENRKKAQREKIERQRENIEASVLTVQLLSKVILKKNPEAQMRVSTGAKSIGAIANSIVQLRQSGLTSGTKILLSGNIANAALAIVGMFGPMGKDPTITLLEQGFSSVRDDIKQLSVEMHDRFDQVDRALDKIHSSMNTRFDSLDKRLVSIDKRLVLLDSSLASLRRLEIDAWRTILARDYKSALRYCFNPEAFKYLNYAAYARCLDQVLQYGTEDAKNGVISGSVYLNPTAKPRESVINAAALEPEFHLGLFSESLRRATTTTVAEAQNPAAWSGAVDSYIALRNKHTQLREGAGADVLALTQDALGDFQTAGNEILDAVFRIRTDGAIAALSSYQNDALALAKPITGALIDRLAGMDLGLLEEADYREIKVDYIENGNDTNLQLYRGTRLVMNAGPNKDQLVIVTQRRNRMVHVGIPGPGSAAASVQIGNYAITNDNPAEYGLNTYGPMWFEEASRIAAAKKEANKAFLAAVPMVDWPSTVASRLVPAIRSLTGNPDISALCKNLNQSKQYLVQTTMLYRGPLTVAPAPWWYVELAALPAMALRKNSNCSEFLEMLVAAPKLDFGSEKLGEAAPAWIERTTKARLKTYADEYKKANSLPKVRQAMLVPEIHLRLDRIKRCLATANPC